MSRIEIDIKAINRRLEKKFLRATEKLIEASQQQLTEEVRRYPRMTIRKEGRGKTGQIATSPRDVVDTGELIDSLDVSGPESTQNETKITAEWKADHASYIYYGTQKQPPHPWIRQAMRRVDLVEEMNK